jgi:ABC-type microcin C transport system permease subunit YejE
MVYIVMYVMALTTSFYIVDKNPLIIILKGSLLLPVKKPQPGLYLPESVLNVLH